jgi:uncharacterized protein (TIGR02147 family)
VIAPGAAIAKMQVVPASSDSVFSYLDYRRFLADYYARQKRAEYGFSYRVLSRRAGCKSTNYPCLVIKGKRNLTEDMALRFAKACGLEKNEAAYFGDLVQYNQARGGPAKERAYARLLKFAQFRKVHQLSAAQAQYFSEWYIPAVRELAARADFQSDPEWIAGQLLPTITQPQAKRALKVLFDLGFLTTDERGRVRRAHDLVSSGGPLGHQLIAYHRAMLDRASAAIDLVPRDEREISSVTLCVSQAKLLELKQQIRDFRQHLLQTAEKDNDFERVVQVCFQLFPISKGI